MKFQTMVLVLSLLAVGRSAAIGGVATKPNVIVVMTDDQGYGEFSCHGNPIVRTPHVDRLAAESLRLTDFHVAPMCTPTRGQLMTGLDAFRNGAMNVSSGRTLLRAELKTMADVFRAGGYRTGIFGKWHLGDNYPFRPEDRGFDEAVWFPSSHISSVPDYWDNDYFDDTYVHNGRRQPYQGYCTDVFFREAMRWIERAAADGQPFFAYLPLNAAHGPWFVPDAYRTDIRAAMKEHPEVVERLRPSQRELLVSFLAMGANIDENLGRFDAFLTEHGLRDNTVFVFLTDNGSTMGPLYFNAGMRGGKTTLWEGGHRVPCFIRWPGGSLGEPRDIDQLSHVQDLLPTLADLAGVSDVPAGLDGASLAPVLRGERPTLDDRMLVVNFSRMPIIKVKDAKLNPAIPKRDGAAVLWNEWRLLENRELYNVESDPHQDHDVAAEHPEVVAKMRAPPAGVVGWGEGSSDGAPARCHRLRRGEPDDALGLRMAGRLRRSTAADSQRPKQNRRLASRRRAAGALLGRAAAVARRKQAGPGRGDFSHAGHGRRIHRRQTAADRRGAPADRPAGAEQPSPAGRTVRAVRSRARWGTGRDRDLVCRSRRQTTVRSVLRLRAPHGVRPPRIAATTF